MAFDIDMIKKVYTVMGQRIDAARAAVKRPLTQTEKILYAHLFDGNAQTAFERGKSYVDFAPDRVGMEDATAHPRQAGLQGEMPTTERSPIRAFRYSSRPCPGATCPWRWECLNGSGGVRYHELQAPAGGVDR